MGDINGNVIHLQRSINKLNEETSGKNENAQRTLVLNDLSKGILANQKQALFDNGILSDFVFPYNDGEHAQLNIFYKRWVRYRDSNGIKNKASPYELRHTFVSVAKALPEGVLKSIVGHSQGMDTYGVYSHEVNGELSAIAE